MKQPAAMAAGLSTTSPLFGDACLEYLLVTAQFGSGFRFSTHSTWFLSEKSLGEEYADWRLSVSVRHHRDPPNQELSCDEDKPTRVGGRAILPQRPPGYARGIDRPSPPRGKRVITGAA